MTPSTSYAPAFGRLLLAILFLLSGLSKIAAPDATIGYIGMVGPRPLANRQRAAIRC